MYRRRASGWYVDCDKDANSIRRFGRIAHTGTPLRVIEWPKVASAGASLSRLPQQWNFSPPVTEDECEEYKVNLPSATGLELSVRPDISGGETRASLESLKLSVRPES